MDRSRSLWERFSKTGRLADYIEYARVFRREKGEKRGEAIERSEAETPDQSSL